MRLIRSKFRSRSRGSRGLKGPSNPLEDSRRGSQGCALRIARGLRKSGSLLLIKPPQTARHSARHVPLLDRARCGVQLRPVRRNASLRSIMSRLFEQAIPDVADRPSCIARKSSRVRGKLARKFHRASRSPATLRVVYTLSFMYHLYI